MRGRIGDEDRESSAILVNRSENGVAVIQHVWRFRDAEGAPSVLLPYGLQEKLLKRYGYWHVILPGSKRYLSRNGKLLGDGFSGPNHGKLWEQVVASADAHEQLIRIASEGRDRGAAPQEILDDIAAVAPAVDRATSGVDDRRKAAMQRLGWQIAAVRQHQGDEGALRMMIGWGDARVPRFHKIDATQG